MYYNIMDPPSYMRSVVDRNVFMRRLTVYITVCRRSPRGWEETLQTDRL